MNMKRSFLKLAVLTTLLLSLLAQPAGAEVITTQNLREKGIKPLNDSALRSLIVNRTLIIRNRVSGQLYESTFYKNGNRLLLGLSDPTRSKGDGTPTTSNIVTQGIAAYRISDSKLFTRFSGKMFVVQVYKVDGKFLAAGEEDGGNVNWEIVERTRRSPKIKIVTVAALQEQGVLPLDDQALTQLIVGKTLLVTNRGTNERFQISYSANGTRQIHDISEEKADFTAFRSFHGGVVTEGTAPYKISESYIVTTLNGKELRTQVFRKKDQYLAAGGEEGGLVNWEVEIAEKK